MIAARSFTSTLRLLVFAALLALLAAASPIATPAVNAQEGVLPIGVVQGSVERTDDGREHESPFDGEEVLVQGVIYQETLSSGGDHGFFIQSNRASADGDPTTSDGLFVFHFGFETIRVEGGGFYEPQIGDEVILRGPIDEFFNFTELVNPFLVEVVDQGVDIAPFETDPPDDFEAAGVYWERRESMRAQVPAGSVLQGGRDVFGESDGEQWAIRGDHPVAQRDRPYTNRVFRDPHPLDNKPPLFDDGNGYRINMASFGLKAAADDPDAIIAPGRTFDVMTNAPTGGVYYTFGKYVVQISEQLELEGGLNPAENAPPERFNRRREYSSAVYNVENLYDFRDDPFDGCDFEGNDGCPGVFPPFDYVPPSDAAYEEQLNEIAAQIVDDLYSPDLLLVQEAEDQDICSISGEQLVCGETDNADGRPDTLQELALTISAAGGPSYDAVYDRDGADDRGIVSAIMYRTDRVELLGADPGDAVLGADPQVDYRGVPLEYNSDVSNPKALNAELPDDVDLSTGADTCDEDVPDNLCVFTRDPQVGKFRVWRVRVGAGTFTDLYAISNHFSSGPDDRVGQRTEQARYNAAIVEALQEVDPGVRVIVGGDLNVFPYSDQLAPLYDQGLFNLYFELVDDEPQSAYSYVFDGQAQTLDQQFVTPSLLSDLEQVRAAHINADWPAEFDGDGPRGVSDHDPVVARFTHTPGRR